MPDHGQQPGKKHTRPAVSCRPGFRHADFGSGNPDVRSDLEHHRPAQPARAPIHDRGAHPGSERAGEDHTEQREFSAGMREISGGRNDDLARYRDDRALERHECRNKPVPALGEHRQIPIRELVQPVRQSNACGLMVTLASARAAIA